MDVTKSGYYAWINNPLNKRQKQKEVLDPVIKSIFTAHKRRYGASRIRQELLDNGITCSRTRISARMKVLQLTAKANRKFKATTDSNHSKPVAENLLQQNFAASKPNQKWLTDITYIPTKEGWLYLCVFIDLYSRAIIGWSMGDRLKSSLVENALMMALFKRKFPKNVIVHSDRGSQYCSNSYQSLLRNNGLICSMSCTGCCYDNAAMESFFHTLKVELVHDENYETREIAKTSIFDYIENYYNRKRRHSAINYMFPEQFEKLELIA